jgi:Putative mono-oxygenase ydhR
MLCSESRTICAEKTSAQLPARLFCVSQTNNVTKEIEMITALIQFKLPQPLSREKAREVFSETAPKYREIHGLIRKYYVLSQDGGTAGGVYLWHSQEDAERLYTDEWKQFISDKYGALPTVTYLESPVIVDNVTGEIIADDD